MIRSSFRQPTEIPPVTDWEDFSNWCERNGRTALPATQETLSLYFRDRAAKAPDEKLRPLGTLSLSFAIAGLLVPVLLGSSAVLFAKAKPDLAMKIGALVLSSFQVIALGTGLISRSTPNGRSGITIALATTLVMLIFAIFQALGPR